MKKIENNLKKKNANKKKSNSNHHWLKFAEMALKFLRDAYYLVAVFISDIDFEMFGGEDADDNTWLIIKFLMMLPNIIFIIRRRLRSS